MTDADALLVLNEQLREAEADLRHARAECARLRERVATLRRLRAAVRREGLRRKQPGKIGRPKAIEGAESAVHAALEAIFSEADRPLAMGEITAALNARLGTAYSRDVVRSCVAKRWTRTGNGKATVYLSKNAEPG